MDITLLKTLLAVLLCVPVFVICFYVFIRVCKDDKEADYSAPELYKRKRVKYKKEDSETDRLIKDMSAFDDEFFDQ